MRTTIIIALLLLVSAIFAYPTLHGEGITQFTVYGEQRFELVDEIDLGDEPVVVRRAPATKHALGEVTIEKRKEFRELELTRTSDPGVTLRKSEDLQYWEWYDANNNLLNRCQINPYISEIVDVNTNGYWLMFEEPKEDPYDFIEEQYNYDDPLIYAADFRYNVESSNFASQSGVVIYDSYGNKMTQVELAGGRITNVDVSPLGNYFRAAAWPKGVIMNINGIIVWQSDTEGSRTITFSPNEELAFLGLGQCKVLDLSNGKYLANVPCWFEHPTSVAVSDKEAGIVAVPGGSGILVFDIWAEKLIVRFKRDGGNIQLSGDGRLLSFTTKGKVVTYRLDEIEGE